jgi:hypothetical protein
MTASERLGQASLIVWLSGHRRQLAKLNGEVSEAPCRDGSTAAAEPEGGRPPFRRAPARLPSAHDAVQSLDGSAAAEAAKSGSTGRGTGHGLNGRAPRSQPRLSRGEGALVSDMEGGAGV